MEKILSVLENIKGYLPLIRLADLLDVAIVAYLVYKLLSLVKSTRAANILKGVAGHWLRESPCVHSAQPEAARPRYILYQKEMTDS